MNNLLDRPLAFHRAFVDLTGSVTAALFLSQAVYWQYRNDGHWTKTRDEWTEETGLSRREQETARKRLRELPFYHEQHAGMPRQTWYHVDLDALMQYFSVGGMRPSSRAECARLVGRNAPDCEPSQSSKSLQFTSDKDSNTEEKYNPVLKDSFSGNPHPPLYNSPPPPSKPKFEPPTREECVGYFAEIGGDADEADGFFDHFDNRLTKAWHLSAGRGPLMRDWRAAARNWHRNQACYRRAGPPKRKLSDVLRGIGIEPEEGIDDAI